MTSEQQSVVSPTPAAVCANCGYSRAGVTDPKAPCPECGAPLVRLSNARARRLGGALRLVAWSLGGGVGAWFVVSSSQVARESGPADLFARKLWVVLVALVACTVGLWSVACELDTGRIARRVVKRAIVLGGVLCVHQTGVWDQLLGTAYPMGLSIPGWLWHVLGALILWVAYGVACLWILSAVDLFGAAVAACGTTSSATARAPMRWGILALLVVLGVQFTDLLADSYYAWLGREGNAVPPWPRWLQVCYQPVQLIKAFDEALFVGIALGGFAVALACGRRLAGIEDVSTSRPHGS